MDHLDLGGDGGGIRKEKKLQFKNIQIPVDRALVVIAPDTISLI